MEDYRLEQSGQEVQDILNGAAMQTDLTAENERAELAEQTLQGNIDAEALARENADGVLQGHIDDEETRAKAAEKQNADDIDAIEEKIPTQASSSNQLADKDYVEDLVSTSSATFRGTFNLVSDLHLTVDASYADIAAALGNAIAGADNNDFAFVMIPTSVDTPNEIASIEKYKFNGSVWGFEYMLNNSGFTAAQWAAINSGITSALVTKLGALPSAADLAAALLAKQDKLTFDQAPTPSSTNPVTSGGVYTAIDDEKGARVNADAALQQAIEAILLLIPSAATALNQLADKAFVNSSIATATATFRGTFNLVSDLQLTVDATHADIAAALLNAISGADNNDYAFVQIPTSVDTPTEIRVTERYKFNGTAWQYEYDLNNSGFTAAQWEAINSGITALLVTKLSNLPNATELAELFAGKQNVLSFDNAPVQNSDNPVKSGGLYNLFAAIDAKMPTGASANNKLVAEDRLAAYVGGIIGALDATFDLTSTDGHVTLRMTQTDGVIASLQILTSDIASASALATLGGQVSTNADDIAALKALYNALQQSAPQVIEPTDTWPVASPSDTVIYRVIDRVNTPPQYYSDYMWNGTTMVLMATYNNAIDPLPKKDSQNLVTSGGVFNNMGALDVSELNATENPHHLAQYVDLSAALAAVPTDYQKGGMSIKFVQSSDNKYVQYFLTKDEWSSSEGDWEKINLEREIYGIANIQSTNVKLYSIISENFSIVQHGNGADIYTCPVEEGKRYKVNFYPIFSSNDTGTYIWVFTNTANTIDLTTAIAHSEFYTEHFSGPTTEIELVAPQFAKTLYVLSSRTPVITEYRDLAGNTTDNLNSFASENALSANAGRQAAYIANQKGLSLGLKHICNGEPITHIDISNIGENKWIKEKNFEKNYFLYSLTHTSNTWFATPEFHPTGRNLIHIKFRIKIERTGGATNTMTIYISNATAPGGVYYHTVATIGDDGYFDLVFDPAYYVVYEQWEHFYIWFWMNGAVSASQKVSFKIYDLQIVEYDEKTSFANISGENAKALFESTDAKLTEIDSKTNDSIPTLIAPNGAKYIMAIDNNGNISPIPVIPNKATIFGNSLVSGFSYVGGDSFGMCASAPNEAFKSLFYDYISSVNPSFVGAKYGAAPFETISDVSQIDYAINAYFLPALVGDEDLVIIELGDNVSVANEPVFAQSSVALLQAIRAQCPNARVVWLGIWYGNETKYNIVKNACEVVGCEFITLSELVTSENMGAIGNVIEQGLDDRTISDVSNVIENTATNITITFNVNGTSYNATIDVVSYSLSGTTLSYRGNYGIVTSGGVASHPGDRGMKAIANKLLYKLGIVNNTEYYPL